MGTGGEDDDGEVDPNVEDPELEADDDGVMRLSYLEQWQVVIDSIVETEPHLLDEDDQMTVAQYLSLPDEAKELFIKLMLRKHRTLRVSKLNFPGITDMKEAANGIVSAGLATKDGPRDLTGWLELLSRDELKVLAKDRKMSASVTPISEAHSESKDPHVLRYHRSRESTTKKGQVNDRVNLKKDAAHFVPYRYTRLSITWPTRDDFVEYFRLIKLEADLRVAATASEASLPKEVVLDAIATCASCFEAWQDIVKREVMHCTGIPWMQVFTPGWVLTRIVELLYHLYGRVKEHTEKIFVLKALLNQHIFYKPDKVYSEASRKARYLNAEGEEVGVENLVLQWFQHQGWKGYHSENSILSTLFGMLFWDILFDDTVPGVFSSPFQDAPLDLRTEFFYESRKEKVDKRLKDIEAGEFLRILEEVDDRERPLLTRCRAYGGGIPDLCVWNIDEKKIKLVEVKGQGDHLSDSQKNWLDFLHAISIPCEVFHVKLPKVTKRKRASDTP
ncbi:hypothetical protein HDV05_003933 [Chytridiales sp. JEL 0842]|nr:hypothetical protein HDV05_003933 [Chytridiales sp. JEL 0842]